MKIQIFKEKNLNICVFLIFYELFAGFLVYNIGLPSAIRYLGDLISVYLLLICIRIRKNRKAAKYQTDYGYIDNHSIRTAFFIALLWLAEVTVSAFINGFHPQLWIWAFRNWGRLFVFLFICTMLFNEISYLRVCSLMIKIFHINFCTVVLQFVFLRTKFSQDAMNGIIGGDTSGMNIMLLLCVLLITYSGVFLGTYSFKKTLFISLEAIIVAALSELRIVFIVMPALAVFYAFLDMQRKGIKVNTKLILLTILMPFIILAGAFILQTIYPAFNNFLSLEKIIDSVANKDYGYAGSSINRLTIITTANKYFFTDTWQRFTGLGFGNTEYSTFSVLTSDFYRKYGSKFLYLGFASAVLYTEGGWVGLITYAGIYVYLLRQNLKRVSNRHLSENQKLLGSIGYGMVMLNLIFIVYGNYQRTDAAYIIAFMMAALFIRIREAEE